MNMPSCNDETLRLIRQREGAGRTHNEQFFVKDGPVTVVYRIADLVDDLEAARTELREAVFSLLSSGTADEVPEVDTFVQAMLEKYGWEGPP